MAITRLQQARQLYAVGQLVSKTLDGSRPGYRGSDFGGPGPKDTSGADYDKAGSKSNKSSKSSPSSPTGPSELGVSTRSVNPIVSSPAQEIIGGKSYDVTPETKDQRNKARVKAQIMKAPLPNITKKGTEYYDPSTGTLLGFAPNKSKKFNLVRDFVVPAGLALINPGLAAKYQKAKTIYNTAKFAAGLAETLGITDKNVVDSFTGSLTDTVNNFNKGKKSTKSTIDENITISGNEGGDGINTLQNADALNQEYLLLLNKFNTGVFTDADQVRFTFLQKILGK